MKALSKEKTNFDYPFPWDRITTLSLDLKSAMPLPWKERKSRFRKNRGKVLLVQMDGSGLSAKFEELLRMADTRAGGKESREEKWLGQGLSTHAHSCAPHTRGHRGPCWLHWWRILLTSTNLPLQSCANAHLKAKFMAPTSFSCPSMPVPPSSPTHLRPHPSKADSPLEELQPVTTPLKMWHPTDVYWGIFNNYS